MRACREAGDAAPLGLSLQMLALFLVRAGKIPEALPLVEEAHEIAMAAGLTDLATAIAPPRAILRRTARSHYRRRRASAGSLRDCDGPRGAGVPA